MTDWVGKSGDEYVRVKDCAASRREIFGMIVPRWALFPLIGTAAILIVFLLRENMAAANHRRDIQERQSVVRVDLRHIKEAQSETKESLKEIDATLRRVERSVNGGRHE